VITARRLRLQEHLPSPGEARLPQKDLQFLRCRTLNARSRATRRTATIR
jgi:hypothetical protein